MTNDLDKFFTFLAAHFNCIINKVQMHFLFHNASYFKYGKNAIGFYFNFAKSNIEKIYKQDYIYLFLM